MTTKLINYGVLFFAVLLLNTNNKTMAQQTPSPTIQWQKSFGGLSFDSLKSLEQTSDGGYILGGYSSSTISGNKTSVRYGSDDYWIIKLDGNGNKIWERSFGGTDYESLQSIQQTSDGEYILGGYSSSGITGNKTSPNYGGEDYWIIKLDVNGNKVWEQSFGGTGGDKLSTLHQTSDGGYILGGWSSSIASGNKITPNYGSSDYWVIKLDSNGSKVWEQSFGGTSYDLLLDLQQTRDDGFILGGWSHSVSSGNKTSTNYGSDDCWLIKLDANGNKVWERSFGGSFEDYLYGLQQTTDGGYILGAYSYSGISGNKTSLNYGGSDYWIIKLDGNGNKIWEKFFGGLDGD